MAIVSDIRPAGKLRVLMSACIRNGYKPRFWRFLMGGAVWSARQWESEQWSSLLKQGTVPTVPLQQIVPGSWDLMMEMPVTRGEWDTPYVDLVTLGALVRHAKPKRLFEFGTYRGAGTLTLIGNSPPDATIVTLDAASYDTREETKPGDLFRGTPYENRITQLLQFSNELDTTPYAGKMDFIFVDAGHEYDCVVNDIKKSFEMLAPGGVIAWHDYPYTAGVRQGVDEIAREKKIVHVEGTRLAVYVDDRLSA
jgi:predicted O-methyltransferase YrrM